ncbi:MAG: ferric reductase-like transmembrane domain-containing protein [Zoogloeaceae bacterium]|jgi:predicted ferric reductase|nr:ferric reductase-like transmembrane domain-containing protein [Zoogloeaceae bacterium]
MKKIKWTYAVLFIGLTLLWLIAEQPWAQSYSLFTFRAMLVNYTGILVMGAMSLGMILALRPVSVEPLLGGLDKSYRLHKWLGVTALVIGIVHWLWATGFKWAVGWGWLTRPARGPRPQADGFFMQFVQDMRDPAEHWGEWAFYIAAALIVLALIKRFPYRFFFSAHRLIAIVYLVLVFHSVVLIKFDYWQSPVAWVMLLLMLGGVVGAVMSLIRRIGHQRRALGTVEALEHDAANRILKVDIRLARDHWEGHAAGQFAFVTFGDGEGAHPFTISSAWNKDGLLSFRIKELGDYTARLPATLRTGDGATVEGPYGCFHFESDKPRQIWVAGGIGVTPFIARLEELARQDGKAGNMVDLFYSAHKPDAAFVSQLRRLADASGVTLHLIDSERDGKLDVARLCETAPAWKDASLWFCGPTGFGHSLRQGLAARGFEAQHFHQELFDMR